MNKRALTRGMMGLWAGSSLMLAACASNSEPPTDALQAAETSISKAEEVNAAQFAPVEMRSAHDKMTMARESVQKEDMLAARRQAEEAHADADLAAAKASAGKAQAVNEEMQRNIETLRQEAQRSSHH